MDEAKKPLTPEAKVPPAAPPEPVVFSIRDWLILPAALALALLWRHVFGFGALLEHGLPALGAALFILAIWACVLLGLGRGVQWNRWNAGLAVGVGLLTAASVMYGDYAVRMINYLLILCGSALAFFSLSGCVEHSLDNARCILETVGLTFRALFLNWTKPFSAAASEKRRGKTWTKGVLIGLVCAVPPLILIISLLSQADAVFGNLFIGLSDRLEAFFSASSFWKLLWTLLWMMLFFSALYFLRHPPQRKKTELPSPSGAREMATVPLITVLVLLCAVYGIFVAIQFAYLFGGAETAAMTGGYAQYARSGFFQLVLVAVINLAAILATTVFAEHRPVFRVLCSILIGMTAVILFSAFWRMRLYTAAYGLSLLRAMTLWAMAFISVCLVLAALRVWWDRFRFWPFFAAVGLAGWIVFNFINIDARIAAHNVDAYLSGQLESIDVGYLTRLSADTWPALERLAAAPQNGLSPEALEEIEAFRQDLAAADPSWQAWCVSSIRYR